MFFDPAIRKFSYLSGGWGFLKIFVFYHVLFNVSMSAKKRTMESYSTLSDFRTSAGLRNVKEKIRLQK